MRSRTQSACVFTILTLGSVSPLRAELQPQPPAQPLTLENTAATNQQRRPNSQEKLARIWANEPALVRLARDKFGAELTETDAQFFAAVTAGEWADFRPSPDAKYDTKEISSWADSPVLKADRINWLCTDPAAVKLVASRGVWLRGVRIDGTIDLYRSEFPYSLTLYECLLDGGLNLAHAKLQELDVRNSCSAAIKARGIDVAENVYLLTTTVYGGLDFIDAVIGGDFDFSGGLALHTMTLEDIEKPGVSLSLYDAKVGGDVKLTDDFRTFGQVRLIGAQIGRGLTCAGGQFNAVGRVAIDVQRANITANVAFNSGFRAEGGVEMRRTEIGGDLDCDGGRFIAAGLEALNADLVNVGGQIHLGDGFRAEGEVRFINSVVGGDIDCDNGHFLHEGGDALSLDGAVIGRSLRIGYDGSSATDAESDLPAGFHARGTVRLWGTQVNQDILANGGQFETPTGVAILARNLRVVSRIVLAGVDVKGTVDLFAADVEHELDLRGSQFDARRTPDKLAIWANGMQIRGHVYCNEIHTPDAVYPFRVDGLMSFEFATIGMHWDLYGAQLIHPGGDALEASDCRVGGYVNLNSVTIDGRASFSRAKIDGIWVLDDVKQPERLWLDMRFAHIWVIKDERLDDWPPAGQLKLEGLVYDHFDDDSPLSVEDRLAWLRRQYAPTDDTAPVRRTIMSVASTTATDKMVRPPSAVRPRPVDDAVVQTQMQVPSHSPSPHMATPAPMMAPPTQVTPHPPSRMPVLETAIPEPETQIPDDATTPPNAEPPPHDGDQISQTEPLPLTPEVTDPAERRYITQPYTQLASVYRAIGQDEQANSVLVARAERLGELSPVFSAQGFWYRYLGRLIGYGYEPFRAIKIGVVIIFIGVLVFALGAHRNLMAETKLAENVLSQEGEPQLVSPTYPRFNPFVYSLDVFLPFVDLNQVCYWIPGERPTKPRTSRNCLMHVGPYSLKWSAVLRGYLWFQTLAGWTLCTLLAAAVTGIVDR